MCIPNETEKVNVFNESRIIQSKTLLKHATREYKCKFNGTKCNSNQKSNEKLCWGDCKSSIEHHVCEKCYVWDTSTCACKIKRYWKIIICDSVVICTEIIDNKNYFNKNYSSKF